MSAIAVIRRAKLLPLAASSTTIMTYQLLVALFSGVIVDQIRVEMTSFVRVDLAVLAKFAAADCFILRLCHSAWIVDMTEANVVDFPLHRVCLCWSNNAGSAETI
jgi:hypothetical protein